MKNSINRLLSIFLLTMVLTACGNQNKKENQETSVKPDTVKEVEPQVILENQYAKVVKVSLAPGEALAAHEGKKRLIYSLSDYSIAWEEAGKDEGVKMWKKGDVHFHEAGSHAAKNNGDSTAEWLAFIKKDADLPECGENTLDNDVNSIAPDFADKRFDNDVFKITEVTIPQGESIPMHAGVNRIIYSLSDYQIAYESEQEGKGEKTFKSGNIHWHEACQHALENTGETEAKFMVVAFKK